MFGIQTIRKGDCEPRVNLREADEHICEEKEEFIKQSIPRWIFFSHLFWKARTTVKVYISDGKCYILGDESREYQPKVMAIELPNCPYCMKSPLELV